MTGPAVPGRVEVIHLHRNGTRTREWVDASEVDALLVAHNYRAFEAGEVETWVSVESRSSRRPDAEPDPIEASRPAWDAARRRNPNSAFAGNSHSLAIARVAFVEGYAAARAEMERRPGE